jgi:uncharacterized lipoprotein YbaY
MADTVAYLNMDMVGRNSEFPRWNDVPEDNQSSIYISAAKFNSRDLYALLVGANKHVNLLLREDKEDRMMRSDTGNFIRAGVPTLKAFTGEHPDYHKVTDTPDKINYEKVANVAKWIYLSAQMLGSQQSRPKFESGARYLTGRVTYLPRVALTADAVVELALVDVTQPGSDVVLDTCKVLRPGQVPIVFALRHDAAQIRDDGKYVIRARIHDRGSLRFSNGGGIAVLTGGARSSNVEVDVLPVD